MNVFEVVKENVTARQAAEAYGLKVGRTGMACCPFHSDKSPSMKLDERYYCFGCGATGDAVDLTAKLFGIGLREAAVKLAEDFGLNYDSRQKPRCWSAELLRRDVLLPLRGPVRHAGHPDRRGLQG